MKKNLEFVICGLCKICQSTNLEESRCSDWQVKVRHEWQLTKELVHFIQMLKFEIKDFGWGVVFDVTTITVTHDNPNVFVKVKGDSE